MEEKNKWGGFRENSGRKSTGKSLLRFWTFKGNKAEIDKFIKDLETKPPII
jgi:hypothetical protein